MTNERIEMLIEKTISFGRTQLDWDIEDARYDLIGEKSDGYNEQRKARLQSRLVYKTFLMGNIQHAVEMN